MERRSASGSRRHGDVRNPPGVDGRPATARRCPRDGQPLCARVVEGVEVDVCLECEGAWLDRGELDALTASRKPGAAAARVRDAGTSHGRPAAGDGLPHAWATYPCPGCGGDLIPRFYRVERRRHEIRVCRRCEGLWLEVRELRRIGIDVTERAATRVRAAGEVAATSLPASEIETGRPMRVGFPGNAREWFVALTGLPLDVGNPCAVFPVITWLLILLNAVVFATPGLLGVSIDGLVEGYGLEPNALRAGEGYRLLTSMFLHGGIVHLAGNLFFLYTFGDNLEERYGSLRFLVLYLLAGTLAGLLSVASALASDDNAIRIGASGAISGVLGAYLVTFPRARILVGTLVLRWLPLVFRAPAWGFVVVWAGFNLIGWYVEDRHAVQSVDHVAHLGGFVAGIVLGAALAGLRRAEDRTMPSRTSLDRSRATN